MLLVSILLLYRITSEGALEILGRPTKVNPGHAIVWPAVTFTRATGGRTSWSFMFQTCCLIMEYSVLGILKQWIDSGDEVTQRLSLSCLRKNGKRETGVVWQLDSGRFPIIWPKQVSCDIIWIGGVSRHDVISWRSHPDSWGSCLAAEPGFRARQGSAHRFSGVRSGVGLIYFWLPQR